MDYLEIAGFAADAIGEPGERRFLLQFFGPFGRNTYLLEKGQVAALVAGAGQLSKEIGYTVDDVEKAPIIIDEVPHFRIGQLGLGWDGASERVVLTLESVAEGDDQVTYHMTMEQLMAAVRQGEQAVGSGRALCERCGLAMDPDGHACPTTNGDLRNHQP